MNILLLLSKMRYEMWVFIVRYFLCKVSRQVAIDYESYMAGPMGYNKQVPQTLSTLIRDVHFNNKN